MAKLEPCATAFVVVIKHYSFIEELKVTDIKIAFYPLDFLQWQQLSLELEHLIIQAVNPPYNVRTPARDEYHAN